MRLHIKRCFILIIISITVLLLPTLTETNADSTKAIAAIESVVADARHFVGDVDGGQAGAVGERPVDI